MKQKNPLNKVLYEGYKGLKANKIKEDEGEGKELLEGNLLLIIDSLKKYGGQKNTESLLNDNEEMVEYANGLGKNGVSIMGDMGSFLYKKRIKELVNYELHLPRRFEIKLNGICLYHHKDFDRVSEDQKQKIINQHEIAIRI